METNDLGTDDVITGLELAGDGKSVTSLVLYGNQ